MNIVALTHGYPPLWNMGGEVSLHRSLVPLIGEKFVLTSTDEEYEIDGVNVKKIHAKDVLNIYTDHMPIARQLGKLKANVVIGQNELSLAAVSAAKEIGAISIVNVHTPPKYGRGIRNAMLAADYAVYNTRASAKEWGEPEAFVLHPPINELPKKKKGEGDAYTLLSSLVNKGVEVVLELAKKYPDKRFIIVRSPAEPTHGLKDLEKRAAKLPNVELHPRVAPEEVYKYLEQTRILLVPSRYETYGMSAIEAANYGIPSVHVDTPHVREGIGDAAILVPPLDAEATARGIDEIESNYKEYSKKAKERAKWLRDRQEAETKAFIEFIANIKKPIDWQTRRGSVVRAIKKARLNK
jgi:glycosyltransferase involved in cell wall biosynthesis